MGRPYERFHAMTTIKPASLPVETLDDATASSEATALDEHAISQGLLPWQARVLTWLAHGTERTVVHDGPPMSETTELLTDLTFANRAGLLTLNSQPARTDQRAFLEALAPPALAVHLAAELTAAGLWVSAWPMTGPFPSITRVLVTDADQPSTGVAPLGTHDPQPRGYAPFDEPNFARDIAVDTLALHHNDPAIAASWWLMITDPQWDQPRHLWESLTTSLSVHRQDTSAKDPA